MVKMPSVNSYLLVMYGHISLIKTFNADSCDREGPEEGVSSDQFDKAPKDMERGDIVKSFMWTPPGQTERQELPGLELVGSFPWTECHMIILIGYHRPRSNGKTRRSHAS